MKPKKEKNNLALLGLVGFFGIFGVQYAGLGFVGFLLFFFFFSFLNVPADELFWQYVHKAALRALIVFMALTSLLQFFTATLASKNQFGEWYLTNPTQEYLDFLFLGAALYNIIFIITVSVFMFTLMYFVRKEKKGLDIPEVNADAKNPA